MHKKPLVAVFVLVLLLVTATAGWGAPVPQKDGAIAIEKGQLTPILQSLPADGGTPVYIQAGTPLVLPGTFCTGDFMGAITNRFLGTFEGGTIYYSLQDPSGTLPFAWNPAGCTPVLPATAHYVFNVTAVDQWVSKRPSSETVNPFTFAFQPIVFDAAPDTGNPGCMEPAGVLCAGPVYAMTLAAGATAGVIFPLNLPFTVECCVHGPYFAANYLAGTWAPDIAQILTSGATGTGVPPQPALGPCHQYIDCVPTCGITDINDYLPGGRSLWLYSEGYTPEDPATQCNPGACADQWWYGGGRMDAAAAEFAYVVPNNSGTRTKMGVRFVSDCQDTLKSMSFMGYTYTGAPDILVEVWDPAPYVGCWTTAPGPTLRYSTVVSNINLVDPPLINDVPLPDIIWGSLNGGLPQDIYVSISAVGGQFALYTKTLTLGACGADPHTVSFVSGNWLHMGDYFGDQDEVYIDANVCEEVCPIVEDPCSPAGPDSWPTWAHDYRRTSATSMNLGDPCKVRAQWSTFLPQLSNFTNPVIAGDRIYVSSDNRVNSYDLATGVAGASVSGAPYLGGQIRSNVSVVGDRVFMTGGTGLAISCWNAALTSAYWSNSVYADPGAPGLNYGDNGKLKAQNRFGVTAVYAVGADSIVVVGTEVEAATGNGWLYALDVSDGTLYSGWTTNPIPLDHGSFNSPAYDGTNLYVGTTASVTSIGDGSLYAFSAATGLVAGLPLWNYKDVLATNEGWPGGASVEGDFVYAATYYNDNTTGASSGHRYAIDKTTGVPAWRFAEGPTYCAAPTIGRSFLYIPQRSPSAGVLMIDKAIGKAVYNWSADGVGSVPCNVTLTCDKYLFAGDEGDGWYSHWWLLNVTDQKAEWQRDFTGIVNGTAIAHHSVTGDDYAVVNARSSFTGPAGAGVITAWRFNDPLGDRPFIHQYTYETDVILVPLNSPDDFTTLGPYTEKGVYGNDGCADLHITNTITNDISPSAANFTQVQRQYAAAYVDRKIGNDYVTYFEGGKPSKKALQAGALARADEELTVFDKAMENVYQARSAKRTGGATAAGANSRPFPYRTGTVNYTKTTLAQGDLTDLSWMYNGFLLGRGVDDEIIETVNDDPDYYPEDLGYVNGVNYPANYPILIVHYVGGCPDMNTMLDWNTLGAANQEKVFNRGGMGDQNPGSLVWGADGGDNTMAYDGSFLLMGDSSAALGGAAMHADFYGSLKLYVPDPRPDSSCDFDGASNVLMGYRRDGSCGAAVPILGQYVTTYFSDTDMFYPPTDPLATLGTATRQVEIGAYDPMYGDFKLIWWTIGNRDLTPKTGLKAGLTFDWDVPPAFASNVGVVSDAFNGYGIWDAVTPSFAYGSFDPNQTTSATTGCGVDPTPGTPFKILVSSNQVTQVDHSPGKWVTSVPHPNDLAYGWALCSTAPFREYQISAEGPAEDRSGWLIGQPFDLAPKGDPGDKHDFIQALFGTRVLPIYNNAPAVEALCVQVAKRAARWAGYARGDVNDDGCVNLADVCDVYAHVQNPAVQLYPDTYCGDVDVDGSVTLLDYQQLLDYVSALPNTAPKGAWRFTF